MKNVSFALAAAVFFGVLVSCASTPADYPQPDFEQPLSYVIDANEIKGRMEDNVRFRNTSKDSNISFKVYVHDPKLQEWIYFGLGELKGHNDTDFADSNIEDIDGYRYFAVESLNGKEYSYRVYKAHNDLYIDILDK